MEIVVLSALFLSVGIFAATNLQDRKQVSDLTLANIEAMTEIGIDVPGSDCASRCEHSFLYNCQINIAWPGGGEQRICQYQKVKDSWFN